MVAVEMPCPMTHSVRGNSGRIPNTGQGPAYGQVFTKLLLYFLENLCLSWEMFQNNVHYRRDEC